MPIANYRNCNTGSVRRTRYRKVHYATRIQGAYIQIPSSADFEHHPVVTGSCNASGTRLRGTSGAPMKRVAGDTQKRVLDNRGIGIVNLGIDITPKCPVRNFDADRQAVRQPIEKIKIKNLHIILIVILRFLRCLPFPPASQMPVRSVPVAGKQNYLNLALKSSARSSVLPSASKRFSMGK